jgi:hypothetical protein
LKVERCALNVLERSTFNIQRSTFKGSSAMDLAKGPSAIDHPCTQAMILCVGTTPAVQRVMIFRQVALDGVNRAITTLDGAAGKSVNVAKVLKVLGEQPVATGFLGGDDGAFLRSVLEAKQIELDSIPVPARTRLCVTVVDQSSGKVTELVEESGPVRPADFEKLLAVIRRRIDACRAVVMSGEVNREDVDRRWLRKCLWNGFDGPGRVQRSTIGLDFVRHPG